jgi:hypothetical protein
MRNGADEVVQVYVFLTVSVNARATPAQNMELFQKNL